MELGLLTQLYFSNAYSLALALVLLLVLIIVWRIARLHLLTWIICSTFIVVSVRELLSNRLTTNGFVSYSLSSQLKLGYLQKSR